MKKFFPPFCTLAFSFFLSYRLFLWLNVRIYYMAMLHHSFSLCSLVSVILALVGIDWQLQHTFGFYADIELVDSSRDDNNWNQSNTFISSFVITVQSKPLYKIQSFHIQPQEKINEKNYTFWKAIVYSYTHTASQPPTRTHSDFLSFIFDPLYSTNINWPNE